MSWLAFIGRILFGSFFIFSGLNHLKDKKSMVAYAKSKKVWEAEKMVIFTGVMLIISGGFIILGVPFAWASKTFLVPFLIAVNVMMHPYWKEKETSHKKREMLSFMYNLALIGALLVMF